MSIAQILPKPAASDSAVAQAVPNRWRWLKEAAREPFLHFILLGGAIFALSETVEHFVTQYRVVVGPERVARLKETFEQQFGAAPTDAQLKTLVDGYIKEEIEYRESLALGLDRDDEIVRRRLVQKYEFLQQDLQLLEDPSEADLKAYYDAHRADYTQAAKRSFTQVYFSPDLAGEDDAHARAEAAFQRLKASGEARAPSSGDPFPGPDDVADLTPSDAGRLFGSSDLSRAIFTAPQGQWVGPYRSGFGWHLLRVTGSAAAEPQPFEAVQAKVLEDWKNAQRTSLNGKALLDLKRKYKVVIPGSSK